MAAAILARMKRRRGGSEPSRIESFPIHVNVLKYVRLRGSWPMSFMTSVHALSEMREEGRMDALTSIADK